MVTYTCAGPGLDGKNTKWDGSVEIVCEHKGIFEVEFHGRHSEIRAILGKYSYGNFICIPSLNIGCPMADWSDIIWNIRNLRDCIGEVDATTVAAGLQELSRLQLIE